MKLIRTLAYIHAVVFALMATGALDHPDGSIGLALWFTVLALLHAGIGRMTKGLE